MIKNKWTNTRGVIGYPILVKKFLHILHGRFSGTHCLISLLKTNEDDFCFISSVPIFQIFGSTYEMVSCPFHTVFADG